MIFLPLLLQAAAAASPSPVVGPVAPATERYERCLDLATDDPQAAEREASAWRLADGGFLARQCLGMAYSKREQWKAAADAFTDAAQVAEVAKDSRAAQYWAQAGNAWLAGGEAIRARTALDAALASGTLKGLELGEAHLDRARALVASKLESAARADLDAATVHAAADPLTWLLSATLARRMNELARAQKDIRQALERSPDDASVQLEAGNIAAMARDAAGAQTAWKRAIELAPGSPIATAAHAALSQFGAGE